MASLLFNAPTSAALRSHTPSASLRVPKAASGAPSQRLHRCQAATLERGLEAVPVAVDMQEFDTDFMLTADVPGLSKNDLKVHIDGITHQLTISGERKRCPRGEDGCFLGSMQTFERPMGHFKRTFPLPETADPNAVHAKVDRGVLTLTIKKKAPAPVGAHKVQFA